MIFLNITNVESLVFQNSELRKLLSSTMFNYFEQWKLGLRVSFLKEVGKQAILDFLLNVGDYEIDILEKYLGEGVIVEKLNYNRVLNLKIPLNETKLCQDLCEIEGFHYYTTSRDDQYLYATFWR